MKKVIITVIAVAMCSGAVNALELENISAKDIVKMTRETQTVVPEPQKLIMAAKTTKAAQPITDLVFFKSGAFAELLTNSLNVKPEPVVMAGVQSYRYKVGKGLTCYKRPLPSQPHMASYSCAIIPAGGWKFMGMESYGAGDNREFSLALYAALNVKETNDEGMKTKAVKLERPDGDGGTERNQMYCINPSAEMESMGFRPSCQFLNAL